MNLKSKSMNIFDCKRTAQIFKEIIDEMNDTQRSEFSSAVKGLFDKKQVSPEGEYDTFKITEQELYDLAQELA